MIYHLHGDFRITFFLQFCTTCMEPFLPVFFSFNLDAILQEAQKVVGDNAKAVEPMAEEVSGLKVVLMISNQYMAESRVIAMRINMLYFPLFIAC